MTRKQSIQRISLTGEFSIFTAAAIRERILAGFGNADEIEVDLAQVTEIDSAGVQLMVAAKQEAALQHKSLRFTGHSPAVLETLDLCELSAYLGDPVLIHSRA